MWLRVDVRWIFGAGFSVRSLFGYGISGGVAYSDQMRGVVTAGEPEIA